MYTHHAADTTRISVPRPTHLHAHARSQPQPVHQPERTLFMEELYHHKGAFSPSQFDSLSGAKNQSRGGPSFDTMTMASSRSSRSSEAMPFDSYYRQPKRYEPPAMYRYAY
eukprot:UN30145